MFQIRPTVEIVRSPDVTYCFAGDAAYNQKLMPAGKVSGVTDNLAAYKKRLQLIRTLGRQEPNLIPARARSPGRNQDQVNALPPPGLSRYNRSRKVNGPCSNEPGN